MKHVEYKLPAEWICKEQQQHPGEENHKQIDIKLCREKQTNKHVIYQNIKSCDVCQWSENTSVSILLRSGLMVYLASALGSIWKHVFLLNRPMLMVVSLCRSRNKPWNQLHTLKRSSSCSSSSPSTIITLNTLELHTLTCQREVNHWVSTKRKCQ